MPKRTIIILIILGVITILLLILAVSAKPTSKTTENITPVSKNMIPTVKKTAVLSFNPSSLNVGQSGTQSASPHADIMVATHDQKVSGVQIELKFDPNVVSNIKFDPSSNTIFGPGYFAPEPLIDYKAGTALYMIGIAPSVAPSQTQGTVVRVSFSVKNPGHVSSVIAIQNESKVTEENTPDSILLKTQPLTLQF